MLVIIFFLGISCQITDAFDLVYEDGLWHTDVCGQSITFLRAELTPGTITFYDTPDPVFTDGFEG